MNPHEELFHRLLDESSALLAAPERAGITIPNDDLHHEIIVPLLPAMLGDAAIRGHWNEQHATGFIARISRHFENGDPAPRWTPGDFEIHVTASYSAGPDARALADTLLSEESLRDMTAALMNQLLDALWPSLAPSLPAAFAAEIAPPSVPLGTPATPEPAVIEELQPAPDREPETSEFEALPPTIPEIAGEADFSESIQIPPRPAHAHALVRALCRKLPSSLVRRKFAANAAHRAAAAIFARRIQKRAKQPHEKF